MTTRVLTSANATKVVISCIREAANIEVAVAWAGKNAVVDALASNVKRVRRGVIGTHMYQTDPDVLDRFRKHAAFRYMVPTGGLFHPKVYLFTSGDSFIAVVGSHNLTPGAFGGSNIELSVHLEGSVGDPVYEELQGFIQKSWAKAEPLDDDNFLRTYRLRYEAAKAARKQLDEFKPLPVPQSPGDGPELLSMSWTEFLKNIEGSHHAPPQTLLLNLEEARRLLARDAFCDLEIPERKAVAGTFADREDSYKDMPWGWFGSMVGQGNFKNLVIESPDELSAAMDCIPLAGEVTEDDYNAFVERFTRAFAKAKHKGEIPTASRLLAMKRPDQFVAVNKMNRKLLCKALGVAPTTVRMDNYWERIIEPIRVSDWWRAPRPTVATKARIWDCRAALLDAIYYRPDSK